MMFSNVGGAGEVMFPAGAAAGGFAASELAPTPRSVVHRDGTAKLYRFERPHEAPRAPARPLLIVPSLINRWYVLDLRPGASFIAGLCSAGIETFCLDWGEPEDEDRYLTWDDVLARLARAVSKVKRLTGATKVGLLGYCMGGTLSAIHTAHSPEDIACLVNLAGPIDFGEAGALGEMVDERWFDVDAIAGAGNVNPLMMQSGFVALRPTMNLAKMVGLIDRGHKPEARRAFAALETWSSDNIAFPAAAYRTYIRDLYQQNRLLKGTHTARGKRIDLGSVKCPVLCIVAERDAICPPKAACALIEASGASDTSVLSVPGGHVGAVIGSRAARELYPTAAAWLGERLAEIEPTKETTRETQ